MSTLTELGDYLEDAGVGTQGTDLFLGSRPDEPDTVLVVYQYTGGPPEYTQDSFGPSIERPQIQILARAPSYEAADALAWLSWSALSQITNAVLSGVKYLSVRPNSSPGMMGRDTNDRLMVSFNATVEKEAVLAPVS